MKYYLAIDIGASSGRHILSWIDDGKIQIEEVYRFENGIVNIDNEQCWNHERLFNEIVNGLIKCKEIGKIPSSVGIDTWGVDFVLLDKDNKIIGNTVSYRDNRTVGMDDEVYKIISQGDLYQRTGIQKAMYNTIYQLMAIKINNPDYLKRAKQLLFTPDYFHYLLSGNMVNEYTIASTSQLLNPQERNWDYELIEKLGYPKEIFNKIVTPGTKIGQLRKELADKIGYSCDVVAPCSHDTASAVLAVPASDDKTVYISSGTWSLMGIELHNANCSEASMKHNFTNEGGYDYRYRYLKNIMGLWMIQSIKKESDIDISFGELCDKASRCDIKSLVDCYDDRFLSPASMTEEIKAACKESNQQIPEDIYEIACVVYNSLAKCYADTIEEIDEITGLTHNSINVVGGGSNAEYLNELTAKYTKRTVYAGPGEATAIGNVATQMLSDGAFSDIWELRNAIYSSFGVKKYEF